MFCPNCGAQSGDGAKFCYNCGFNLSSIGAPQGAVVQNPAPQAAEDTAPALVEPVKKSEGGVFSKLCSFVKDSLSSYDLKYDAATFANDIACEHNIIYYTLFRHSLGVWAMLNDVFNDCPEDDDKAFFECFKLALENLFQIKGYNLQEDIQPTMLDDIASGIIDDINEQTSFLGEYFNLKSITNKIIIEEEAKSRLSNQLYNIYMRNTSNLFNNFIQQLSSLQSKQSLWININKSQTGDAIMSFVKGVAGGALAVANPFLGISVLVGNYFYDKHKDESRGDTAEMIGNDYEKLVDILTKLREKIIISTEEVKKLTLEKIHMAITQRNDLLSQYVDQKELIIAYNKLIGQSCEDFKGALQECPDNSFVKDWLLEENISQTFRRLLTS